MAIVRKARYLNMSILLASGFTMPFWKTICVSLFVCTSFSVTIIIVRYSKVVVSVLHLLLSHRIMQTVKTSPVSQRSWVQIPCSLLLKWCPSLRWSLSYSLLHPQFTYMIFIYSRSINVIKSRPFQAYKEIDSDNNNRD